MNWLSELDQSLISEDLPVELREGATECVAVLSDMFHTLTEGADKYFISQWTLSRAGRKKMREYLNNLPTVRNIMPPKTEFTNVPDCLIFSNRFNWVNAEYELFVAVVGSRICIKNGNPDSKENFFNEVHSLIRDVEVLYWCDHYTSSYYQDSLGLKSNVKQVDCMKYDEAIAYLQGKITQ